MKPFNLEDAIAGKPVITRDGRKVKIAGYNPNTAGLGAILGWLDDQNQCWTDKGTFWTHPTESPGDLFMDAETKWVRLKRRSAGGIEPLFSGNKCDLDGDSDYWASDPVEIKLY